MIVLDRNLLSTLARALREQLAVHGVETGHQASLNLMIEALGLGSPNRVSAELARSVILVDYHHHGFSFDISAQMARHAAHEETIRGAKPGVTDPVIDLELPGGATLGRNRLAALVSVCLKASRAVFARSGVMHVIEMPVHGETLSKASPFVARLTRGQYGPKPALLDGRHAAERLAERINGRRGAPSPIPIETVNTILETVMGAHVEEVGEAAGPYRDTIEAIKAATRRITSRETVARSEDPYAATAERVLHFLSSRGMIAMEWPDGGIQDLRWVSQPDVSEPGVDEPEEDVIGEWDPVMGRMISLRQDDGTDKVVAIVLWRSQPRAGFWKIIDRDANETILLEQFLRKWGGQGEDLLMTFEAGFRGQMGQNTRFRMGDAFQAAEGQVALDEVLVETCLIQGSYNFVTMDIGFQLEGYRGWVNVGQLKFRENPRLLKLELSMSKDFRQAVVDACERFRDVFVRTQTGIRSRSDLRRLIISANTGSRGSFRLIALPTRKPLVVSPQSRNTRPGTSSQEAVSVDGRLQAMLRQTLRDREGIVLDPAFRAEVEDFLERAPGSSGMSLEGVGLLSRVLGTDTSVEGISAGSTVVIPLHRP